MNGKDASDHSVDEQSIAPAVWKILRARTDILPDTIKTAGRPGRKYQVLEVLVTVLLQKLQPDYTWTVTPLSQDEGVDLFGRRTIFDLPELSVRAVTAIVGQCKTSVATRSTDLVKEFSPSIARMRDSLRIKEEPDPSLIVLVALAKVGDRHRRKALRILRIQAQIPVLFLSSTEIDYLLRENLGEVEPYLQTTLRTKDYNLVVDHLRKPSEGYAPKLGIAISKPTLAETGQPFSVFVEITSDRPLRSLRLRWEWPRPLALVLVRPLGVEEKPGVPVDTDGHSPTVVEIRLISYRPGRIPLGSLTILFSSGVSATAATMGELEVANAYHPPFYRAPSERYIQSFELALKRVLAGNSRALLVTGAGGLGKSRLVQYFALQAEQEGALAFSVSHPRSPSSPGMLLRSLLLRLLPKSRLTDNLLDDLEIHFRRRDPELAERDLQQVRGLLSQPGSLNDTETQYQYNPESLLRIVSSLVLERALVQPLFLHIADLHWASSGVLDLLFQLTEQVRRCTELAHLRSLSPPRLLLVLEGRAMEENLSTAHLLVEGYSTIRWEALVRRLARNQEVELFTLSPLDPDDIRGFIESLFESLQVPEEQIPRELVPNRELLIDSIQHHSGGNPFYVTEYVKLLLARGDLRCHERTGLLYLPRPLPNHLRPPSSVTDLMRARILYYKKCYPDAALVLSAAAFLRERISQELFSHLWRRLAPKASLEVLLSSEILDIEPPPGDVRFRHEYHFQILHRLQFDDDELAKIIHALREWLDRQSEDDAESVFDRALLARRAGASQSRLREAFENALDLARHRHRIELAVEATRILITLYGSPLPSASKLSADEVLQLSSYLYTLGRLATLAADWREAKEHLGILARFLEDALSGHGFRSDVRLRSNLELLRHKALVQQANLAIHLLDHEAAMQCLHQVLLNSRSILEHPVKDRQSLLPDWRVVYLEANDRSGIAHWFNGDLRQAEETLLTGVREAERLEEPFWRVLHLLDLGAVLTFTDPERALKALEEALDALGDEVESPKDVVLARLHRLVARIAMESPKLRGRDRVPLLEAFKQEAVDLNTRAAKLGYTHEEGKASLIAGSCLAVLESGDAGDWFMRSARIAHRHEHLGHLWKAHVNLAQFLAVQHDPVLSRGLDLHARLAEDIIFDDLERRRPRSRASRLSMYWIPLQQLGRIWAQFERGQLERFRDRCSSLSEDAAHGIADGAQLSSQETYAVGLPNDPEFYFLSG